LLEQNRRARADEISALAWVADGVDYTEREAAEMLIAAARWYPDTFSMLLQRPWVNDGVNAHETVVIKRLRWAAKDAPDLAERMLQKSWAQDDITRDEAIVIESLYWTIRVKDESLQQAVIEKTIQILDMPFLDSVESPDAAAVRSLRRLEGNDTDAFLATMSHPKLSDGITDEEAKIVALLGATHAGERPEQASVLLQGTGIYLEERTIQLPHSDEVLLTVIRVRDQVTPSMDYLEHAVRIIEGFMEEPLPTNWVAWYFDDVGDVATRGANHGTHISSPLRYDIEGGDRWKRMPYHIAHEVAHYYWRGNSRDWLDEGPAKLFESISERERVGTPVQVVSNPCAAADTIAELESKAVRLETWADTISADWFRCNYSLGERLFVGLFQALGEETFRQGFRDLYLKSQRDDPTDGCEGTDLSICHVLAAFKADVSEDIAAKVDEIVARWYGPLP